MKNFWESFLKGAIGGIVVFLLLSLLPHSCIKEEATEPPLPTATTMEFEGHHFIIFYDVKGDICEIIESYDYDMEYD